METCSAVEEGQLGAGFSSARMKGRLRQPCISNLHAFFSLIIPHLGGLSLMLIFVVLADDVAGPNTLPALKLPLRECGRACVQNIELAWSPPSIYAATTGQEARDPKG